MINWRSSLRSRFQTTFLLLALAAIGLTVWTASVGASAALREATYDRLAAIRHTRQHALERYFEDLAKHVVALATSETTVLALQDLRAAWRSIPEATDDSAEHRALADFYRSSLAPRVARKVPAAALLSAWLPVDPRVRTLQYQVIAANRHPIGSKDLLLEVDGAWGAAHARHHPTFHRYQSAFGFYDVFLVSVPEGRVLYTVMKEVDLGADLTREPYHSTRLGRVYQRAVQWTGDDPAESVVIEDFAPYVASAFAPAAFIAAPVRVAGETIGVLAMQLSIQEVDRVMTGGQHWQDEGLGATGQAYVVGPDQTLRSDLRPHLENPERFYDDLRRAGVPGAVVDLIRHDQTTVLNLSMNLETVSHAGPVGSGTEFGVSATGARVLRSSAPLALPGLRWAAVAEIDEQEAFAPVRALQARLIAIGFGVSALFFVVAGWLGASVTRPMREFAQTVARLGAGARGVAIPVRSADEIGQLATAFNRMSADLERTTVSKSELEQLAGRLLTAQEDERRRVARELHDDLVQRIAAMAMEVGRLEHLSTDETVGSTGWAAEQRDGLVTLKKALARLSEDVHRLSRRIHPVVLEELGLSAGIEAECRAFTERGGPPVDLHMTSDRGRVDDVSSETALAVYRIVQEALRNVWQHGHATEVELHIALRGPTISLRIADDGVGFDRSAPQWKTGVGLASMEERARLLGGRMRVTSARGQGTHIDVTLPVSVAMPDGERTRDRRLSKVER